MSDAPKILLGVSGGIAAYKASELVRELVRAGADVRVILTRRAEEFVTPLTLSTLSGHPVHVSEFGPDAGPEIGHIELSRWADALVVAPATANVLARFARGIAEDLLSTVYVAFDGPVVVAPAMNPRMWDHPETRESAARLALRGVTIVPPDEGFLACGDDGAGRLADLGAIARAALRAAHRSHSLAGVRVLVSAGPTHEPIDPVRFVGNRSSGKMGNAVAAAARARGASVTLVRGPVSEAPPFGVTVVDVATAEQMRDAIAAEVRGGAPPALIVMAAAVADHRPVPEPRKMSRKGEAISLRLEPTVDILAELGASRPAGTVLVGFAAETHDAVERGRAKLERKGCDILVVNDVTVNGAGFGTDTNVVTLLDRDGSEESWPLLAKREIAERLLDRVEARLVASAG